MNFLRLNDHLLSALFEDDEILVVDKPYGINSHTNESKRGNEDFIQEGLIEIYERQRGQQLHVIHRLDQTTSGVLVFGKSQEAAKKYAQFFFDRQVKKTYWFLTASKSRQNEYLIDQRILHKGKDLEAKTKFSILEKGSSFELWQANPMTGRNHQIRIHAKAAGLFLLGDEKYGGAAFPFLCLHNHRIEFPNGIVVESKPPKYFEDLNILKDLTLSKALFEVDRRSRLFGVLDKDQCLRLVHGDLPFTVDQFGKFLVLSSYLENWSEKDQETATEFSKLLGKPLVVRMMHNRGKDPLNKSQVSIGKENENSWVANEGPIKYEIRSDSGQSFGLFLDQRLQRNWVLNHSKSKSVLNLFSYTCGFSVAAALGLASQVTSVDTSKNVLNWGRRNFELNGIDPEKHKFLFRDSLDFLGQCQKKSSQFDLIICDPPSFSRGEKGVFKIETSLEPLLKSCLACLTESGELLFSTNFENFFIDDIRKIILKVQKALGLSDLQISSIHSGLDFELVGEKAILKSFLIRKGTALNPRVLSQI